jgi:hypothetical protein
VANLALWLTALLPSITKRLLAALGFGVVSVLGVNVVAGQLEAYIYQSVGGFPADMLLLVNLAGFGIALNLILGALTARLALYAMTNTTRILGL